MGDGRDRSTCCMESGMTREGCVVVGVVSSSALLQCCAHSQYSVSVDWLLFKAQILQFSRRNDMISEHPKKRQPKDRRCEVLTLGLIKQRWWRD